VLSRQEKQLSQDLCRSYQPVWKSFCGRSPERSHSLWLENTILKFTVTIHPHVSTHQGEDISCNNNIKCNTVHKLECVFMFVH